MLICLQIINHSEYNMDDKRDLKQAFLKQEGKKKLCTVVASCETPSTGALSTDTRFNRCMALPDDVVQGFLKQNAGSCNGKPAKPTIEMIEEFAPTAPPARGPQPAKQRRFG